jgi:hypothetical protein
MGGASTTKIVEEHETSSGDKEEDEGYTFEYGP